MTFVTFQVVAEAVASNLKVAPDHVDKLVNHPKKERKSKPMDKPKRGEITKKGNRFKVTLDIEGKKCHIGTFKNRDEALEQLALAKKDLNHE